MPLHHASGHRQRAAEREPRRAGGAQLEDALSRRHEPARDVASGIHATARRSRAAPSPASDPLSRVARTSRQTAGDDCAGACAHDYSTRSRLAHAHGAGARLTWARLLKRVFDLDVERCGCGGKLKIIAAIEEAAVIERILTHLGLSAQPPPRAPARRFELFHAA